MWVEVQNTETMWLSIHRTTSHSDFSPRFYFFFQRQNRKNQWGRDTEKEEESKEEAEKERENLLFDIYFSKHCKGQSLKLRPDVSHGWQQAIFCCLLGSINWNRKQNQKSKKQNIQDANLLCLDMHPVTFWCKNSWLPFQVKFKSTSCHWILCGQTNILKINSLLQSPFG